MADQRSRRKKPSRKKTFYIWMIVMILFIVELFFYVRYRVQCTQMGYGITQARNQNQKHIKTAHNLKVELASLRSHERIISKAKTEFGLVIPGPEQIVVMP